MMNNKTKTILRWILFAPISIIVSEIINYLLFLIGGGLLELISPDLGEIISGIITKFASGFSLILSAFLIIPYHKYKVIKLYSFIWSVITICWTIIEYYLTQKEVLVSFWGPILLNLGFFIGIWFGYKTITSEFKISQEDLDS